MGQVFGGVRENSRVQGEIAAFNRLGRAGGQGMGLSSHWGTSGKFGLANLKYLFAGLGVLAGKQS